MSFTIKKESLFKRGVKKVAASVLTACMAFSTVAAEKESNGFVGNPEETYYMNVFVSGVEYWFPVYEMMKQAGKKLGVKTVYTGTPEYDVNKQLASFEQILARKPAGILLAPINPDPFVEPIKRAREMGIPVVTFGADSPNSERTAYVTSDNVREGIYAADAIAEDMGGKGEYAVLENPGQDNHDKRVAAFIGRMEEKWPDMKLVSRAASNQDPTKAYNALLTMSQAHPNLGAVFMPEASSAMGAAQAAKELGRGIRVFNCDINAKVLDMIKNDEIFGALNPNQGVQGFMGMTLLFLAKHSELIDPMNDHVAKGINPMQVPYVDNGFSIVTKENAEHFYWDTYMKRRESKGVRD
ncbi:substrate-binding domain-containing protein [Vibrio penaeicida]|uniref:substrate-binding domain-containing protein n=1 Tax=Vibrio penaeicida TaxID=104609 RepID=UPI000CEA6297|nr:substrate-binding domain-containing protein [Vibrio penaeicida]